MESQTGPATLTVDERSLNGQGALEHTMLGEVTAEPRRERFDGLIVWLVASIAFLGYLAFGTFSVQIWRYSDFLSQYYPIRVPRRILHIWIYQGQHLPEVKVEFVLLVSYYGALFLCVASAIYGLWLLLGRAGSGSSHDHQAAERRPPRLEG